MPEYKSISAKIDNFSISNFRENNNFYDWKRSHGNHSSNRFSDLKKINLSNIKNLDLAWIYEFKEINRDIQANPVIADGKIFIPTTGNSIVSIDAVNGRKIWEYTVNSTPARRGLIYWSEKNTSKFYLCAEKKLHR